MAWSLKKVLYLGPEGTYTHQAALQQFGDDESYELSPAKSIPECLDELENNASINYAVIPLENSTNGQVVFSYDLLRDRMLKSLKHESSIHRVIPALEIIAEQYVSIDHCLISNTAAHMSDLEKYKNIKIHSHPQVWGQVEQYLKVLREKYPEIAFERLDTSSTSEAVLKTINLDTSDQQESTLNLAIASEVAAKLYRANILEKRINDQLGNTTRFLVFKKRSSAYAPIKSTMDKVSLKVSLITFTTQQDDPGALVEVLTVLKEHSVNMCSINTRPFIEESLERKWQYVFFLEYYHDDKKNDWPTFYDEFGSHCLGWCLWGTFDRDSRYYT